MAKVSSKYQVTLPKVIADQYHIQPGDEIDWIPAGDVIRVIPIRQPQAASEDVAFRLQLFDQATARHRRRVKRWTAKPPSDRGWSREDAYSRGRSD